MFDESDSIDYSVSRSEHLGNADTFEARYIEVLASTPQFRSAHSVSELVGYDFEQIKEDSLAINGAVDFSKIPRELFNSTPGIVSADISNYENLLRILKRNNNNELPKDIELRFFMNPATGYPEITLSKPVSPNIKLTYILDPSYAKGRRGERLNNGENSSSRHILIEDTEQGVITDLLSIRGETNIVYHPPLIKGIKVYQPGATEADNDLHKFYYAHGFKELNYSLLSDLKELFALLHEFGHLLHSRNFPMDPKVSRAIADIEFDGKDKVSLETYQVGQKGKLDSESYASLYAVAMFQRLKEIGINIVASDQDKVSVAQFADYCFDRYQRQNQRSDSPLSSLGSPYQDALYRPLISIFNSI